jgi:hypothetical protein
MHALLHQIRNRFNTSYDDIKSFVQQRVVTYIQTIMLPRSWQSTSVMLNEGIEHSLNITVIHDLNGTLYYDS